MISTTGRRPPSSDAPTAAPTIASSEIGVSRTRSSPKRASKPLGDAEDAAATSPTSSPSRNDRSGRAPSPRASASRMRLGSTSSCVLIAAPLRRTRVLERRPRAPRGRRGAGSRRRTRRPLRACARPRRRPRPARACSAACSATQSCARKCTIGSRARHSAHLVRGPVGARVALVVAAVAVGLRPRSASAPRRAGRAPTASAAASRTASTSLPSPITPGHAVGRARGRDVGDRLVLRPAA